jgi:ribosomal protein S12 methylthiotransferase accessory factor
MIALHSIDDTKAYTRGTHRAVPPRQTWQNVRPFLSGFGISRVADITGLDTVGIPVFVAIRPRARSLSVSQGKGITPILARVSAVMESIELWHAERPPEAAFRAPADSAAGLTYELDDLHLAPHSLAARDVRIDWLQGIGVLSGLTVPVPRDYVNLCLVWRRAWTPPVFFPSSNGLASGNTHVEAVLHGLYEVVERDCLYRLYRMAPEERVMVDKASIVDPDCADLLTLLRRSDNQVVVFDATSTITVPCYAVLIRSRELPLWFAGYGCHLDPGVALARALTEAAQDRLAVINGARDDLDSKIYRLQMDLARDGSRAEATPGMRGTYRRRGEATGSLSGDLAIVVDRVTSKTGIEPLAVNLTHPAIGIPVVKVVAPGLRAAIRREIPSASGASRY